MTVTPAMLRPTQYLIVALLLLSGGMSHAQSTSQSPMSVPSVAPQQAVPTPPATPAESSSGQPGAGSSPPAAANAQAAQDADAVRATYDTAFQASLENPSDPDVLAKFAELAVKVGDIEGAISALERLLLIDGDEPDVKLELGVLYFRLGSKEAARMYLEAARSSSQASDETKERAATFLQAVAAK